MGKDLTLYTNYLNDKIKPILEKYKEKMGLDYLDSRVVENNGEVVIEINIDDKFQISLDQISEFTQKVNDEIDLLVDDVGPYILDISSSSSNRLIKVNELNYFINKYISVSTNSKKYEDVKLNSIGNKKIFCTYFEKGRIKKIDIDIDSINEIHISYK